MEKEFLNKILLENYEIISIVKDTLDEAFQKRFNKNIDYDQWVGIRDYLEDCACKINEKIKENVELNYEALTTKN